MMIEGWNAADDFEEVVDTLESITVVPCEAAEHRAELRAWRFEETVSDSILAPGVLTQIVTTWQIGQAEGEPARRLGEKICDSEGRVSTIRSVRRLQGATRWACESLSYEALPEAQEAFDIERPLTVDDPGGPTIESWALSQTGVTGCFVPREDDPLEAAQPWEIVLINANQLSVGSRLRRRRGGVYAVSAVVPPAGIGEPWIVTAEEIA